MLERWFNPLKEAQKELRRVGDLIVEGSVEYQQAASPDAPTILSFETRTRRYVRMEFRRKEDVRVTLFADKDASEPYTTVMQPFHKSVGKTASAIVSMYLDSPLRR